MSPIGDGDGILEVKAIVDDTHLGVDHTPESDD